VARHDWSADRTHSFATAEGIPRGARAADELVRPLGPARTDASEADPHSSASQETYSNANGRNRTVVPRDREVKDPAVGAEAAEFVLRALPEWFGLEEPLLDYVSM